MRGGLWNPSMVMRHAACLSLPLLFVLQGCDDSGTPSPDVDASVIAADAGDVPTTTDSGVSTDGGAGSIADSGAPRGDSGPVPVDGGASGAPGTGFASSFMRFAVPPSGLADGFFSSAYTLGARGWLVVDIDGDRVPDLVQTSDSNNGSGFVWSDLQGPYWRVFRGTGSGFALTPTRWAVPANGLSDGFFAAYYGNDTRYWSLFDLDGDGRPELVQTGDSARSGGFVWKDAQGPYWKVWRSSSTGFSSTFVRFAVPDSGLTDGFFATSYCLEARCWSLVDLDGDAYADLVQTSDPTNTSGKVFSDLSGAYWKAWAGSASGFASSPRRFGVPASGLTDGFFASTYMSAAPGVRFWTLADMDGDKRPDLVHTADPTRSGGQVWSDGQGASWRVFSSESAGFSSAATRVGVPASGLSDGFFATSYFSAPSAGGERFWMTIDLDGDRRPELVQSADPTRAGGFVWSDAQGPYWKVWHLGGASAPTVTRWGVPPSSLSDGFFSPIWSDSQNGSRSWFLRDLDGDGHQDLVQSADPTRSGLYVFTDAQGAYWKVYRGQ